MACSSGGIGPERILLHRASRTFGYAEVRLPSVNIKGVRIEEQTDGRLTIRMPDQVFLQPVWREAVERELGLLWAQS